MGGFKNCFMAYLKKQIKDLEICQKSVKSIIVVYCETKKHKKKVYCIIFFGDRKTNHSLYGMLRHRFEAWVLGIVVISPYGQICFSFYLLTCTSALACQPEATGRGMAIRVR